MTPPNISHPKFINIPYSRFKLKREKKKSKLQKAERKCGFNEQVWKHWREEEVGGNLEKIATKLRIPSKYKVSVLLTFKVT